MKNVNTLDWSETKKQAMLDLIKDSYLQNIAPSEVNAWIINNLFGYEKLN